MTSTTTSTSFDAGAPLLPPSPSPQPPFTTSEPRRYTIYFLTIPFVDTFFDIAIVALILCFLFFSFLSLSLILHLRIKSRNIIKLQSFSSHWTARFLMIILISLCSINEFIRMPIFRKSYIFPFVPPLSLPHQTQLCKFHLILSFGLYEPGFLVSLLYLLNISVKKRRPGNLWAIGLVAITSLPLVVALYFSAYILPGRFYRLPPVFYRSSVLLEDEMSGAQVVYCTYPLLGGAIFGAFGLVYMIVLLLSCWRVTSLVINRRLKARVSTLAGTVLVCLSVQIVLMMVSVFWDPEDVWYSVFVLVNFVCVIACGVVSEGVLVIKPITDVFRVGCGPAREVMDPNDGSV